MKKERPRHLFLAISFFSGGLLEKHINSSSRNSNNCIQTITFCARFWPASKNMGHWRCGEVAGDNIIQPATAIETWNEGSLRTWYLRRKSYFRFSPPHTNQSIHKQQVQQFSLSHFIIFLLLIIWKEAHKWGTATKISQKINIDMN